MKKIVFVIVVAILASCKQEPTLEFKYADQEQALSCDSTVDALLNEALYSFEEDLKNNSTNEVQSLNNYYGQFMFRGMQGTADYKNMASAHSIEIRDALLNEGILISNGGKSNLNYENSTVACVIENIEDAEVKRTINNLISVDSMDPALFDGRLRNFGRLAQKNRYQAAYIALDAYYQNLIGITLETTNE